MPTHVAEVDLPYTPQQVFDLVADIESYPHFLPHVAAAHILRRDGNALVVNQQVRLKMLKLPFTTRAELDPPRRISIVSAENPFGTFREEWSFTAIPSGGTRLRSCTDFVLRNGVLRVLLDTAFAELQAATLRAFTARANALYKTGRR
jgi:coenzyme Q-binding protein COQ10